MEQSKPEVYNVKEYIAKLEEENKKLKSEIVDRTTKKILQQRELLKEIALLRKQLNLAVDAMKNHTCPGDIVGGDAFEDVLAEIESMINKKDEIYWSPDAFK